MPSIVSIFGYVKVTTETLYSSFKFGLTPSLSLVVCSKLGDLEIVPELSQSLLFDVSSFSV